MALLNICGFETGDSIELAAALSGTASIQSTTKRTGSYALQCNPATTGTGSAEMILAYKATGQADPSPDVANLFMRFYFLYSTKPASNDEEIAVFLDTGANARLSIRLNSAGKLASYDLTPTLLATGTTVLSQNTWYMIEVNVDSVLDTYAIKIDGISELSGSLGAFAGTRQMFLGKRTNRNGNTVNFYFDDFASDDATYRGASQCSVLTADGQGNYTAWTGDYTAVDELPHDGDTSVISTSTNTNAESATMTACPSVASILGVKSLAIYYYTGTSANAKVRLRSGGTDDDTTGFANAAYAGCAKIYATDPATAAAWTQSGVNGIEIGIVHSQSQSRNINCTALYAMVDYTPPSGGGLFMAGGYYKVP